MFIETKRLKLTQFCPEYAKPFTNALNDPNIYTYLPENVPTLKNIQDIIQWFIKRDKINLKSGFTGTNLAIHIKQTEEIIGWCGLQPFDPEPDKTEIFYGINSKHWNNGFLTEAASAVLKYGFTNLKLSTIVAGVKPKNIASIRVLEKIGMNYKKSITSVPKGCEFYLGEFFYSIQREQYLLLHK